MKSKLFKRYFLTTAAIILFCLTFMLLILSVVISNYLARDKYELLEKNCRSVSVVATTDYNSAAYERNLYNVIRVLGSVSDLQIYITDANCNIIVCTCQDWGKTGQCKHTNTAVPSAIANEIFSGEYKQVGNLGGLFNEICYTVGKPMRSADGTVIGTVIAASTTSSLKSLLSVLFQLYALSAIFPLVFMFFAIYTTTYRWSKPLKMMSAAARSMAKGDFSKRIPIMSDDEIGELSVAFNQMTNSLVQLEGMRRSFIANVSHELKTPMTTISGFIDGIIDGTIESEKQTYYLNIVSDEIKRLSRLVQSMLSLSKLESGEFKLNPVQFDICEMLCNIVISQEQRINEKRIDVQGLDEIDSVPVCADKDLIHQVIYNLTDNAIKFTNEQGKISFTLKKDGDNVVLCINNTGEGIAQSDLPHIFERFYKSDKSRSAKKDSTGLGLYIAKTIVLLHKGTLSASSDDQSGTTFIFTLPLIFR